jgi:hypothetical protein
VDSVPVILAAGRMRPKFAESHEIFLIIHVGLERLNEYGKINDSSLCGALTCDSIHVAWL